VIEPGTILVYNGRAFRWRATAVTEQAPGPPTFVVDVDGSKGGAHSLETALLLAARAAHSIRVASEHP
jgi:hypothetical protein